MACAANAYRLAPWVTEAPLIFELRRGVSDSSELLASAPAVGIKVGSRTLNRQLGPPNIQNEPVLSGPAFSASSWDSRLFFSGHGTGVAGKYSWSVRVLRPESFDGKPLNQVNFKSATAFSKPFLLDSDSLTSEEVSSLLSKSSAYTGMGGLERLGVNSAQIEGRVHLSIYPHPALEENPYRSTATGQRSSTDDYETYRFIIIDSPKRAGTIEDTSFHRNFLVMMDAQVIVKAPRTPQAEVVSARIVGPARPLRDSAGQLIIGYEASVSLDGRLIAYSGVPNSANGKQGAYAMYTFNQKATNYLTGWSSPRTIADLYWVHGPGNSQGETMVDGLPFSARFPVAKYPLRDDQGVAFPQGQAIRGSYLWLSLDASEIMMSTIPGLYGARRGTVLLGARTHGKIQLIDGQMNPVRGNPTNRFSIFPGTDGEYEKIAAAYRSLAHPNSSGVAISSFIHENLLFAPVFFKPGSWNAFAGTRKAPLPWLQTRESMGFFVSQEGRYVEFPVRDIGPDLLLALPMNESIFYNRPLTQEGATTTTDEVNGWGKFTNYESSLTPDLSDFHQTGKLVNSRFPYEFYNVRLRWTQSGQLLDRSEGAYGNSVFMPSGSYVDVAMKPAARDLLLRKQKFSFSFWFRAQTNEAATLANVPGVFIVRWSAGKVSARFWNHLDAQYDLNSDLGKGADIGTGQWTHVSLQFDSRLRLFIQGEEVTAIPSVGLMNTGNLANKDLKVFLGPRNESGANRIDLDEVNFHSKTLSPGEIAEQAMRAEIFSEWPASSDGINRNLAQEGELARVPADNPYKASAVELGKQLFLSTDLSMKRNISCATCHQPSRSFTDGTTRPFAGSANEGLRNTPAPIAGAFQNIFHWDGSAASLEAQVLHPILNAGEMNLTGAKLLGRLQESQWTTRFQTVYGTAPSLTLAARALASYLRQVNFVNTSFDSDASPMRNSLSASAQKGWRLFNGKANCVACHSGASLGDGLRHDTGLSAISTSLRPQGDLGASWMDGTEGSKFSFKTPSLRNVTRTAPYFHDGRAATLTDVVDFYNRGGDPGARERGSRSPLIRPLNLNDAEVQNLVDFLRALDADILAP